MDGDVVLALEGLLLDVLLSPQVAGDGVQVALGLQRTSARGKRISRELVMVSEQRVVHGCKRGTAEVRRLVR